MNRYAKAAFGVPGQVTVGALLIVMTTVQLVWWLTIAAPPSNTAIFIVSMEALYFAAYAIIATALVGLWIDQRTPDS